MPKALDYATVITQSLDELEELERKYRSSKVYPRIQMLRLLKNEQVRSQGQCAKFLGFSKAQIENWWSSYKREGLSGILDVSSPPSRPSQLSQDAWIGLENQLETGCIGTLEDARHYLNTVWGTQYQSIHGVRWHFVRMKVKLKTGRPRHRKADPQAQEVFKKLPKRYANR